MLQSTSIKDTALLKIRYKLWILEGAEVHNTLALSATLLSQTQNWDKPAERLAQQNSPWSMWELWPILSTLMNQKDYIKSPKGTAFSSFSRTSSLSKKPSGSPFLEKHKRPRKWEWLKRSTTYNTLLWYPLVHLTGSCCASKDTPMAAPDTRYFSNGFVYILLQFPKLQREDIYFPATKRMEKNILYEIKSLKWSDIWLMILTFQFLFLHKKKYLLRNSTNYFLLPSLHSISMRNDG